MTLPNDPSDSTLTPFRFGEMILTNIENRMERIRGMVTSFYRQFNDWDNDLRVQKAKIVNAELAGLLSVFRGLARQRGQLAEFEFRTRSAWAAFKRNPTFTEYHRYTEKILEICVDQFNWWRLLFDERAPSADVIEYVYSRSILSAKESIIKQMLRDGKIASRGDIQLLGTRADIPERIVSKVREMKNDG